MVLVEIEESHSFERVNYVKKSLSKKSRKRLKWFGISLTIIVIFCIIFLFVGVPLIFMHSIEFQRLLMFTHLGLPSDENYFKKFEVDVGLKNFYLSVHDDNRVISLGVWQLLPHFIRNQSIDMDFDYDSELLNSNFSVLLYFHGTGEDRSSSLLKYKVFQLVFHVITFDYRSYGDSSEATLSESAVVNDCVQIYEWLTKSTQAPIFFWGHSLGSALATETAAVIKTKNVTQPAGLILESAFTKMSDELYVHPYGKIFAWLPWFEATILRPLQKNGFIFDTSEHIKHIEYPVMILAAEDDSIVPYRFGRKLYDIARNRTVDNTSLFYLFPYVLDYDHNFIYEDPFLPNFYNYFIYICSQKRQTKVMLSNSEFGK